jgi:hypothetical protein
MYTVKMAQLAVDIQATIKENSATTSYSKGIQHITVQFSTCTLLHFCCTTLALLLHKPALSLHSFAVPLHAFAQNFSLPGILSRGQSGGDVLIIHSKYTSVYPKYTSVHLKYTYNLPKMVVKYTYKNKRSFTVAAFSPSKNNTIHLKPKFAYVSKQTLSHSAIEN